VVWVRAYFLLLYIRLPAELFLIKNCTLNRQHNFINVCINLSYYAKAICFDHILVILRRSINIKCTD